MQSIIDTAVEEGKLDTISDLGSDLEEGQQKNNEVSALDSLLYAEDMAHQHEKGFYINALRDQVVKERSEFKTNNRLHNATILKSDKTDKLLSALAGGVKDKLQGEDALPPLFAADAAEQEFDRNEEIDIGI